MKGTEWWWGFRSKTQRCCSKLKSAGDLHLQAWSTPTGLGEKRRVHTEQNRHQEGTSPIKRADKPIHPPEIKQKTGQNEALTNAWWWWWCPWEPAPLPPALVAYLHSSRAAGFGVKQGLCFLKCFCFSTGSLLQGELLCHRLARQCTSGIALVWIGGHGCFRAGGDAMMGRWII